MNILMIAFEDGRWGPARLPEHLARNGATIYALCPAQNALAQSSHINQHFNLKDVKSSRHFVKRFAAAMIASKAELVIPCDERVVLALHAVIKRHNAGANELDEKSLSVLRCSLGDAQHHDDLLMKHHTLALARRIGVATPNGIVVEDLGQAKAVAQGLNYPVFLKTSFSWAGLGTVKCGSESELVHHFANFAKPGKFAPLKKRVRKLLARDWYPTQAVIEIQKPASGKPVMYCALAWQGQLLAGFAGKPTQTDGETGPSTVVHIGKDSKLELAARKMIAATGASGFLGFDFMLDEMTGEALLLECNPRPIQVCHLGASIGIDLCAILVSVLQGNSPLTTPGTTQSRVVPLFPQEWLRDEQSALRFGMELDMPKGDASLLQYMLVAGKARGRDVEWLKARTYPFV